MDSQVQLPALGESRAAQAAARVAARYAKAPTFSQMQAEEARVVVRAAEIATQVALEAQAVAQSALTELHAAAVETLARSRATVECIERSEGTTESQVVADSAFDWQAAQANSILASESAPLMQADCAAVVRPSELATSAQVSDERRYGVRWEPDLPLRTIEKTPARVHHELELSADDWWTPARISATLHSEPMVVEAQQSHANLIEFPRELVATRRIRPRLAEVQANGSPETDRQLSIFEVVPGTILNAPSVDPTIDSGNPDWVGAEWSGMELEASPNEEENRLAATDRKRPDLAPWGLRLLAAVVDGSLVLGVFFALAMWSLSKMAHAPEVRTAEVMAFAGIALTGFLFYSLFFTLARSTPGMSYAGIALSTFDDDQPTRAQLRRRLGAMVLSILPVGLGIVWSVFDEDHLSWHDRISATYLRKR